MKRKILALLIAISSSTFASDDYNMLVGMTHSTSTGGMGFDSQADLVGVSYYLNPVKIDSSKPYAEAPYLQRVSSITGFVANTKFESTSERSNPYTPWGGAATIYRGDYMFGVTLQDWNNDTRKKSNLARGYDMKNSVHGLLMGYFVQENTLINYEYAKTTISYSPVGGESARVDWVDESNKIATRTVLMTEEGRFISAGLSYKSTNRTSTTNTSNHEYAGSLRYYPNTSSYVELVHTNRLGDKYGTNGKTNLLALGFELNKEFDVRVSNSKFSPDDLASNYDTNNWQISVTCKF